MYVLEYANNPRWGNAGHTFILLTTKWAHLSTETEFCAAPYDIESHGVEVYNNAVNGDYGTIAEYTPVVPQPI